MKKILIITDSLGLPRKEFPIEHTWVYRLIKQYPEHIFLPFMEYGRTLGSINCSYIDFIKPDMLIIQSGIVDCTRRALPNKLRVIIMCLPGIRKVVHNFAQSYHYQLTKLYEARKTTPKKFQKKLNEIIMLTEKHNIPCAFVRIADAGPFLAKKVYRAQNDIDTYNQFIKDAIMGLAVLLDPYPPAAPDTYLLPEDGHHLNAIGHAFVFLKMNAWIETHI